MPTLLFAQERAYKITDDVVVTHTSVKNQSRSGTCWCFAGIGMVEAEILRKYNVEIDLSEMYLVRWAYANKFEKYVRMQGTCNFSPGGEVFDVLYAINEADKTYYGNFDLVDETGSVYIYGLVDADKQFGIFEAKGLKEGDTITLRTIRTSYKDTPQGKNALYVSHVAGEGGETPEPEVYDVELAYVERFFDVDETELPANHFLLGMIDVEEAIEFAVLFKGC